MEADATIKLRPAPKNFRSKVWKYFGFRENDADTPTCKICFVDVKNKAGNTSNLSCHLKKRHNINVQHDEVSSPAPCVSSRPKYTSFTAAPSKPTQTTSIPDMFKVKLPLQKSSERHKTLTKAIAGFIAMDMRPFSVVENTGFQHLMAVAEPRYTVPSRTHFARTVVPGLLKKVKDRVTNELLACEALAITTDSWTSRATENYLTVTAHAMNSNWEILSFTLETKAFAESHSALNLSTSLTNTVKIWDLERHGQGPPVTTDNTSNIVKAVRMWSKLTLSSMGKIFCFFCFDPTKII